MLLECQKIQAMVDNSMLICVIVPTQGDWEFSRFSQGVRAVDLFVCTALQSLIALVVANHNSLSCVLEPDMVAQACRTEVSRKDGVRCAKIM